MLIASLAAVNKILTGSNLREEGFAWLLVQRDTVHRDEEGIAVGGSPTAGEMSYISADPETDSKEQARR